MITTQAQNFDFTLTVQQALAALNMFDIASAGGEKRSHDTSALTNERYLITGTLLEFNR